MKEELTNIIMRNFAAETSILTQSTDESVKAFKVAISETSKNFCVGLVDIVNSTKITAKLPQNKLSSYYEIFLNSMAAVLNRFGGIVIKSIGDSLLFYFPETSDSQKKSFVNCIECTLAMVEEHERTNRKLRTLGLPPVDYRISVDYGLVSFMTSSSPSIDLVGSPVNLCSKINRQAPVNGIIIGGDLYMMMKNFDGYHFKEADGFSIGMPQTYPIYSVRRKHITKILE